MKYASWIASVSVALGLAAGTARADLISYNFTGIDNATRHAVVGSFSYDSSAPPSAIPSTGVTFGDVHGSLSVTVGGRTYASSAVEATLQPGSLRLFNSDTGSGLDLGVLLTASGSGATFLTGNLLPILLPFGNLTGSTFQVSQGPAQPGPGQAAPGAISVVASGTITALNAGEIAEVAPEPGSLLLALLGAAGLACRIRRRGPAAVSRQ